MTIGVFMLLLASADLAATNEKFTIGAAEMNNPCHLKIEGRPAENAPEGCAAAIASAPSAKQKAILYFAWAYSLIEASAALEALPNLDKAVALAPNFTNARHERSYALSDLGFYDRALIDSNRDVELTPGSADVYSERAFARHHLADFNGALADRLKAIELGDSSPGAAMGVIEVLMWLGRYDEAARRLAVLPAHDDAKGIHDDLARRRQFKPDGGEARRCEMSQTLDDQTKARRLLDDCTWAFDHERDPAKRAEYLTVRGTVRMVALQEANANIPDLQIAVALEPENPRHHINYGFALMGARRSWGAQNEFNIALATPNLPRKSKAMALAGRGQARANLGDHEGAKSDARASFLLEPMEANAWLAGDLFFAEGDKKAAKEFWMAAYRMGARSDSLIENLKSVGVADPEKEPK